MKKFSLWLITLLLRVHFRLTLRLDAPDVQQMPTQGPLIVISNHTGQIEVPVLATLMQPRKITGWAKAEAFKNLLLRWVFWAWEIIPVRRGEADMSALKRALRAKAATSSASPPKGRATRQGACGAGCPARSSLPSVPGRRSCRWCIGAGKSTSGT
ncbi:MAG TPA: 1-acyl-sn-glycerol-3-phosphate acyltransferase [Anaerolineales bacterium]|nr:1-acyl-sn-glycerol-3-phosphate acyltransferase [Anaerolineales bacterium]